MLTHSPTEVKEMIAVDLPSPRDQIATKELPEFAHLRAHVYRLIKRERPGASDLADADALAAAHPELRHCSTVRHRLDQLAASG